jgi:carbamoyl-phosphate synthase large subunit
MNHTILITGIGGDIAQGVARIVRLARPTWRIVGVDIHQRHAGSVFVDALSTICPVTSDNYLREIEAVIEKHQVTVCMPMSEPELGYIVANNIQSFGKVPFIGVAEKAISIGLDKLTTMSFLASLNIPIPWTIEAQQYKSLRKFPCIYKPRRSAGSKGVALCQNTAEAAWHASQNSNAIFQELLLPVENEVTCAVYRTKDGRVSILPMLRNLVDGVTGWAQVIDNSEIVKQCQMIALAVDLKGSINVQLRLTANGPRIFEINPRISSTVYLRHLLGFCDIEWILNEFEGIAVEFSKVAVGSIGVRIFDSAVL